jgi:hypothetical protein
LEKNRQPTCDTAAKNEASTASKTQTNNTATAKKVAK